MISEPLSAAQIQRVLDLKTKPVGSLGALEKLALQLCQVQNTLQPRVDPVRVLIFAADHGVAEEGVSLYPREVTAQMVRNFVGGGAAISVLAHTFAAQLEVIDVGVAADLSDLSGIVHAKIAFGSANIRQRAAMTLAQMQEAMAAGAAAVRRARDAGVRCVALGEMGIANTTAASALIAALLNVSAGVSVGAGTGVAGAQLVLKTQVVAEALARVRGVTDADQLLSELGGLEIAALCGAMLEAAACAMIVLVDGFIVTAAAMVAVRLQPSARKTMVFAHQSAERAHVLALEALQAEPLIALGLRLGEASGAALAIPLVRAAAAIVRDMASFEQAGVSSAAE